MVSSLDTVLAYYLCLMVSIKKHNQWIKIRNQQEHCKLLSKCGFLRAICAYRNKSVQIVQYLTSNIALLKKKLSNFSKSIRNKNELFIARSYLHCFVVQVFMQINALARVIRSAEGVSLYHSTCICRHFWVCSRKSFQKRDPIATSK